MRRRKASIQYASSTIDSGSGLSVLRRYLPDNVHYEEAAPADDGVLTDEEALRHLTEKLTEAAVQAWTARRPGRYANEFGRAAVGMCRRAVYDDGSAKMWGDTNTANFVALEGGSDTGLELLYFFDGSGRLTGVAANLACPAQCVQHRTFLSSDFWGKTKQLLRDALGQEVFLLPLCAPAGDQCPVDLIRWVEPDTDVHDLNIVRVHPPIRKADPSMFDLQGARKAGRRIAQEIIDCYADAVKEQREPSCLTHLVQPVRLPVRRVTRAERGEAERALQAFFADCAGKTIGFYDSASMHVHAGTLARCEFQEKHPIFEIEAHFLRLDDVAFATNPFELFLDYGNRIRAQSPAAQTFLLQLTNGSLGYLPTARAEAGGHYSAYVSSGITGHDGGELLVCETLAALDQLFGTSDMPAT